MKNGEIPDADQWHHKIKHWYSWCWVAQNTEKVYDHIKNGKPINLQERFQRSVRGNFLANHRLSSSSFSYKQCGWISGLIMSFVAILAALIFLILDYRQPRKFIDLAVDYSKEDFDTSE